MSICCCWLDNLFQPRSSVCATRISLGLMINEAYAGMLLASRRRLIILISVLCLNISKNAVVFGQHKRRYGVNRHLRFCPFPKNSKMCPVWVRIIHLTMAPTRHISELKYAPTHGCHDTPHISEFL